MRKLALECLKHYSTQALLNFVRHAAPRVQVRGSKAHLCHLETVDATASAPSLPTADTDRLLESLSTTRCQFAHDPYLFVSGS